MKVRFLISVLFLFLLIGTKISAKENSNKPSFVVIMCDDVSSDMFGPYGNKVVKTPNIDALAKKGVTFASAWNAALCCPARAEIMTGCYATTTGFWSNGFAIPQKDGSNDLFKYHTAFSKILNVNGYATAVAGKWHIGGAEMEYDPILGFDEYCMWEGEKELKEVLNIDHWDGGREGNNRVARYWHPCVIQNGKLIETGPNDFGPDIYSGFISDFIKRKAAEKKPFLAYYPMTMPHGPYVEVPTRTKQGSNTPETDSKISNAQRFEEMIDYIDILIGKILTQLEKSGVADNTIVIFTADNGTAVTAKSRGVERGCHIPFIVSGKGVKARGITSEICDAADILPTLVDFAGATYPENFKSDGVSLMPFVTGETDSHKDLIHACIGTTQLLRDRTHMIEVVNPILGVPNGRFYYTGDNHTGKGYVRGENLSDHQAALNHFKDVLRNKYIGLKADNPYFKGKGQKWLNAYMKPNAVAKHLHNHKDYIFYDETLDKTRD